MRGTIIQWTGENGVIMSDAQRFNFDVRLWKGNVRPQPDMPVLLTLVDGGLMAVNPVIRTELAKQQPSRIVVAGAKTFAGIKDSAGPTVIFAYAAFAYAALFLPMAIGRGALHGSTFTMVDVLGGLGSAAGAGFSLVLAALASMAVPHFWKHKRAPMAFAIPLLITLYACQQIYLALQSAEEKLRTLGQFGSIFGQSPATAEIAKQIIGPVPIEIGYAAYLTIALGISLAARGILRASRGTWASSKNDQGF
jgi:hypothetical protein